MVDTDGDGRYDVFEDETRGLSKAPEPSLAADFRSMPTTKPSSKSAFTSTKPIRMRCHGRKPARNSRPECGHQHNRVRDAFLYYLVNLDGRPAGIRAHWMIENGVYSVLDMNFAPTNAGSVPVTHPQTSPFSNTWPSSNAMASGSQFRSDRDRARPMTKRLEGTRMRRREFIAALAGASGLASALLPSAGQAQERDRVRRIGVLLFSREKDATARTWVAALRGALQKLDWIEGRNLRIDLRFGEADPDRIRASAEELVNFAPDLILAHSSPAANAVQKQTKTVPVVFVAVGDPVANGLVASISRPNGNITGFTNLFPSFGGKWLQLLKEAAPRVARVGLLFDPELSFSAAYFGSVEAAGLELAVQVIRIPYRDVADLGAIDALEPDGGLIVLPPAPVGLFVQLARYRLPTIGHTAAAAAAGALLGYGADNADLFRRAADYVDRILRGAKPDNLPVQFPAKFTLVINLKTASALGVAIPGKLLAQADEVLE
jgi:ABC-type uncharacterized transport system substrate-binding protein